MVEYPEPVLAQSGDLQDTIKQTKSRDNEMQLVTTATRMRANAQRDGRPAYYRWRRLFNAAVWLTPTIRVPCSNAANTRNPLKFAGVPQTRQQISAVSRPKFAILRGHVEEVLLLNKFFSDCGYVP